MASIEFFKASKKDKKPTIRVAQLRGYFHFPKLNPGDEVIISTINYGVISFKASRYDSVLKDCTTIYGVNVWPSTYPQIGVGMKTYIDVKGICVDKIGKQIILDEPKKVSEKAINEKIVPTKVPIEIINKVLNKKLLMLSIETEEGKEVTEVTQEQIKEMFPGDLEMNEPVTIKLIEMTTAENDKCLLRGEIFGGEIYPKKALTNRLKQDIKELEEKRKAIDEEILALNIRIENIKKMRV